MRKALLSAAAAIVLSLPPLSAEAQTVKLNPLEALRYFYQQGDYHNVIKIAQGLLWNDIRQPEVLNDYAASLQRTGQPDPAAVFYSILLNVLETAPQADVSRYKKSAEKGLAALNGSFERQKAEYVRAAAGKKFPAEIDKVSDLWMTQVKCTPHSLHALYAWKLVGGRKDAKPDWIHNKKGEIHRSAAKYVDEVNGRKGLLFCIPNKKSKMTSTMVTRNAGRCKFLRVGTMGYNFTCVLNVVVEGQQVFSQVIGKDAWQDLKIDLGLSAGKDVPVTIELVVPEEQGPYEGIWFDYVDFFED